MIEDIKIDEMGRKFIYSDTGVKVFVDFINNGVKSALDSSQ